MQVQTSSLTRGGGQEPALIPAFILRGEVRAKFNLVRVALLAVFATLAIGFFISSTASAATLARPSAPRDVKAVSGNDLSNLRFLPPLSKGGLRILRYDVDVRPGNRILVCATTHCSVRGLSNGSSYSFTVAAVNKMGRGRFSPASNKVTPTAPGFSITFNANGGLGIMASEKETASGATTLTSNTYTYTGYNFIGWNTAANGTGTSYANGATNDFGVSVTLYAQWSIEPTVTFIANGGTGTMAPEIGNLNTPAALSLNSFSYVGDTFLSWNTAANGTGTSFANGAMYSFTTSVALYAQWSSAPPTGPFPGGNTYNWAGYVLTGQSGGYQAVSAQWTVPSLNCAATPNGVTSDWVGVNGNSSSDTGLFQDGTSSECNGSQEQSGAWWTDEEQGFIGQNLFNVNAGDIIDAAVYQNSAGYWVYSVRDLTSGVSSSQVEAYDGVGASAEWIAEDPGDPSSSGDYPLADFAPVTFSNLAVTVSGGSWTLPPYSDAVQIVDANGTVEATPGQIQGSGSSASFTVYYKTST
jgi:uncharacterized repeat protein (TIGR02543 family)